MLIYGTEVTEKNYKKQQKKVLEQVLDVYGQNKLAFGELNEPTINDFCVMEEITKLNELAKKELRIRREKIQ